MQDQVSFNNFFERSAEGIDQFVRQIGNEAHGIGQNQLPPAFQAQAPQGWVKGGEQHVLGQNIGTGQRVEQRGFSGVGVTDKRNNMRALTLSCGAVQASGTAHVFQIAFELVYPLQQHASVEFKLGFPRAAHKASTATLSLKVGPGPHQSGPLKGQGCQFNLKPTFTGLRALAKDFQNQRCSVEHLGFEFAFKVSVLNRGQNGVEDDDAGVFRMHPIMPVFQRPSPDQRRRPDGGQIDGRSCCDFQAYGLGQRYRFAEFVICRAPNSARSGIAPLTRKHDVDDKGCFLITL